MKPYDFSGLMAVLAKICIGVGIAISPAIAETGPVAPADIPLCQTNLGTDGQIITGIAGLVWPPEPWDAVRLVGDGFTVNPLVRNGLGVLVDTTVASPAPTEATVEFLRGADTVLHRCRVTALPYDPEFQDIARLQVGDCALTQMAGLPQLYTGHMQVWRSPQPTAENAVWPVRVMDISILSARAVIVIGKRPGPAVLVWGPRTADGGLHANLCPIRVLDGAALGDELEDSALCHDQNGLPMRLTVGQTAILQPPETDGQPFRIKRYAIGDPAILDLQGRDAATDAPIVKAVLPGTTSVILVDDQRDARVHGCEVQVQ